MELLRIFLPTRGTPNWGHSCFFKQSLEKLSEKGSSNARSPDSAAIRGTKGAEKRLLGGPQLRSRAGCDVIEPSASSVHESLF
jgi:hypothetical protein